LASSWKEEIGIMSAEVKALHDVNIDLRQRLSNVQQRQFIGRHQQQDFNSLNLNNNNNSYDNSFFLTEGNNTILNSSQRNITLDNSNNITGNDGFGQELDNAAMSTAGGLPAQLMPMSVQGIVERTLFDYICAFTSGVKSASNANLVNTTSKNQKTKKRQGGRHKSLKVYRYSSYLGIFIES
jgi:hypothetical protein